MLSNAKFTQYFWEEATNIVVHLINQLPLRYIDEKMPKKPQLGKPLSYKHLKVFGYEAYFDESKEQCDKTCARIKEMHIA